MDNELLCQILDTLNALEGKFDANLAELNNRIDALDDKLTQCMTTLSKDIAHVVSNDVTYIVSNQLQDIRTEVSIIKSSVGEHELDVKYLKKITIPNFKSPSL